jgi:diadenosine tetraphosphatase ApaH/serine/threonine PP2A family protein phosphatase
VEDINLHFYEPTRINNRFDTHDKKAIVNVGSVGQPRDNDNRASFAVIEEDAVLFKRVPYNFHATMRKIEANEDIHNNCAARLALGK